MVTFNYGSKNDAPCALEHSEDLIAVRTWSRQSIRTGKSINGIEDGDLVLNAALPGVRIYRVPVVAGSLGARKALLRTRDDVRFAGRVLIEPKTGEPILYSENIFIKFADSLAPDLCRLIIEEAGLAIKRVLGYSTNAYFLAAPEGSGTEVFYVANQLLQREDVDFCHPELLRERQNRAIHPNQWHLKKTTVNGVEIDASANVEAAHALSLGEGAVIAVIDDGFDIDHIEFSGTGKVVFARNFDDDEAEEDPRPTDDTQSHGTSVAGVACANGVQGASGVAPAASLMPLKCNGYLGSQAEADAFYWAADNGADVINCSWGAVDGMWNDPSDPLHGAVTRLPASTRLAINYAVEQGRNGKGCVVLFASGNGNESADNDKYVANPKVICVAACNDTGRRCSYSDFGKAVWCAFPSGDFESPESFVPKNPKPLTPGIWTVDRQGDAGYSRLTQVGDTLGDYNAGFSGTSSACPGVAGIAALMLAANPELTVQEVRDMLAKSCTRVGHKLDGKKGRYNKKGRSDFYGHGRVDAERAVRLALEYK